MTTMIEPGNPEPGVTLPLRNEELVKMLHCSRCKLRYMPSKSTSSLRLTYCSFLCELGDLGFSMQGLEGMVRKPRDESSPPAELPEPVAAG